MAEDKKKPSILHLGKFYWPHHGGMETSLQQLADAGVKLGHQVAVWVSQSKNSPSKTEQINQVWIHRFKKIGTIFSTPLNPGMLMGKTPPADVFHVHLPHPIAELKSLWILLTKNIRCIPYLHAFPTNQGLLGKIWFNLITRKILKKSEMILVSNEGLLTVIPQLKEYSDKIRVLPFSTECISQNEFSSLFPTREQNKIILAVGRMVPYKGFDQLLSAWKNLLSTHPEFNDWKLVLIGDGPEFPNLTEWSSKNIPEKNILFTGSCNDASKKNWMKKSTVFVLSSVSIAETFGISLLESFGMGLPAVVSNLPGGVQKLSRNGECGIVFNSTSADSLSNALLSMIQSTTLREKAGKNNLEFAQDFYSENQLIQHYRRLIHGK